ncbi:MULTISPECIES: lytic murein transglycosylase [unclassified Pseudonocardia]|uniref:lytic murein transglycosylase n=1 Tax=unclassified Pseudonocardia TaxID=2619320 RepID=UPI001D03FBBD|nr:MULTISPECIES: lytic murein transglycosylase [unclassified Pseudonocardia]
MAVRVVLSMLGVLFAGVLVLVVLATLVAGPGSRTSPSDPVDRDAPPPAVAPLGAGTDVVAWSRDAAGDTRIPQRTLQAYATAELRQRERAPECRLSWSTLAGIGRVESRHARIGGATTGPDGRADPPIVGIALDGTDGTRRIADTDGGRLDGDPVLDRAVGPMQFLPETWGRYGADGDGDGVADPQQVDDAALAAAGLLCAGGRDAGDGDDWWDGVLAYNASGSYARDVWSAAADYGRRTARS